MVYAKSKAERDFRLISDSDMPQRTKFNQIKIGKKTLKNDVLASIDSIQDKRSFVPRIDRKTVERAINN